MTRGRRHVASQDGNGAISLDELRTVFETLGRKPTWDIFSGKARKQNQEDEDALREQAKREFGADLLKMMREVDTDNSGSIDSVEFAELISAPAANEMRMPSRELTGCGVLLCSPKDERTRRPSDPGRGLQVI